MKTFSWKPRAIAVLAGIGCLTMLAGWARNGRARERAAQAGGTAPAKTAAEQYKNIQVLKDIPADQLIPSMQFIAGSLGVGCDFCHVEHQMDKDDKKEKKIARKMIAMQLSIDKDNFEGHLDVTCYTCHRGSTRPVGIPVLTGDMNKMPAAAHEEDDEHTSWPPAEQILNKYVAAIGGADALKKIKTREQKGTIEAFGGRYPIEVYSEAPEKRVSITHPQTGPSVTAFNGEVGWLTTPVGIHKMSPAEGEAARIDASLYFPIQLREMYQNFKVRGGEDVGGRATIQVQATAKGKPGLRLYFDQQNGLLLRLIRYAETPLGRNPTQIDYADYRDTNGVKIPYQWTLARPGGSFTIHIESVQQNVPINEKLFVPPPEPPAQ